MYPTLEAPCRVEKEGQLAASMVEGIWVANIFPPPKKKKKDFQQIFVFSWDLLWMKQHCISYSYHYKLMFQFSQDF